MAAQRLDSTNSGPAASFGKKELQRHAALIRRRLGKKIDKDGIELLTALFEQMDRYAKGVDAEQFRIDFKHDRQRIDRLVGRLMTESYEPHQKIYRPTMTALPLIGTERARKTLALIDRVLGYFAAEFERERHRQITLKEISHRLDAPLEEVADAVGYIVEGPASGSRSTGWPQEADWYFVPGENALDFPDLASVIAQLAGWLRSDARPPGAAALWWQRIRSHKVVVALIVIGGGIVSVLSYAGNIASAVAAITKFLSGAD